MISNSKDNLSLVAMRILFLCMIISFAIIALPFQEIFASEIGVAIDNQDVEFTNASGYPFIDKASRTQVPLRITMEAYGCNVDWDRVDRVAIVERNGITVNVPIDKPYILVNGEKVQNDTMAQIKDGRTYLPIRAVLEAFGASVGWNSITKTVVASNPENLSFVEESIVNLEKAIVTKHIDGDTFYVKTVDGIEKRLRLIGLDTPEIVHPNQVVEYYGEEASKYTQTHLFAGRVIYMEKDVSEVDKYDRLLRYVWLDVPQSLDEEEVKGKMFNAMLIAGGYAQASSYPPDIKYQEHFTKFNREAREGNQGLWAPVNVSPEPGQSQQTQSGGNSNSGGSNKGSSNKDYPYLGNTNSYKFHYVTCSSGAKTLEHNRTYFKTRQEAINAGYVPCKVCNP